MEPAVFFDGRSSRRRIVALAFNDRLAIADTAAPDGPPLAVWPYDAMRRVDSPTGALRLAYDGPTAGPAGAARFGRASQHPSAMRVAGWSRQRRPDLGKTHCR